ncbi:G/T mismatch-specific thymine DNA glycosylase-like isoform X1 [Linepithema humile]|uniref:G/T mismatch-specific thymine DNA glycosylase-like isoform X1 n=1 Tax=Linepithema humile TaxID=83485 RepID=UPI0006235AA0|nr:PREDICTED: G/T mismatch-specific thymine DNA glycosylase-like isoform X2 [Linepithema humile]
MLWKRFSVNLSHISNRFLHVSLFCCTDVMSLDLNKLKKRKPTENQQPKKKIDRFDGLSEEEVQKYTLEDYLEMNLDIVFVGINPSLMAAHRGRYYAGPGNHFYKLLHESGLTSRFVSFEEDYKLLQYSIGLTNIVTRPTRSAADLKRTEIKEGASVVEEKLKLYKPKVAVFNGKCIYEVFANITSRSSFHFGLQPERIDDTAIWVVPSSSARCAHFPRMVDKLHFYTGLKKYLQFLKGEISNVDVKEFQFEGKCKQSVASTSKMWRRKNISTFLHGGRVANKYTLCLDTSEEDIAAVRVAEFLVEKSTQDNENEDKDAFFNAELCSQENQNQALFNKTVEKTKSNTRKMKKFVTGNVNNEMIANKSENKEASDINRKENCTSPINDAINQETNVANGKRSKKCKSSKITRRTVETRNNLKNNRNSSLDFMSLIKERLSQKSNDNDTTS